MRHKNKFVHYGVLGFIYGVAALTLIYHVVAHNVSHATAAACTHPGQSITVAVQDHSASPATVQAQRCDVLELVNKGKITHVMAAGEHEHHSNYGQFSEALLRPGRTLSISLVKTGTYTLHDHLDENLQITFNVR